MEGSRELMLIFANENARSQCREALSRQPLPPNCGVHTVILPHECSYKQLDEYIGAHPYVQLFIAVACAEQLVHNELLHANDVNALESYLGFNLTLEQKQRIRQHVFNDFSTHPEDSQRIILV